MSVLGAVAAGVTGFFTGWNPAAMAQAYAIGSGVESIVNPPNQIGPRLEDLKVQTASYGSNIPFEWGVNRHSGTVIWPRNLVLREVERTEGGKGGPEVTTFTYYADFAVLICEGPITAVRRIWANKKLVYDVSAENTGKTKDVAIGDLRIYLGTDTQEPDAIIEAMDGDSPAYRGYAYAVFEGFDLTEYANRPPLLEFEVITEGETDIPPATVYGEHYGLGAPDTGSDTFKVDMDDNGYVWISTMEGHAVYESGQWTLDENGAGTPQIQQYDPRTKQLIWAYDIPPMTEVEGDPEQTVNHTYAIKGELVASGGWVFTGRGEPGTAQSGGPDPSAYAHGLAINTATRAVSPLIDSCSHIQFNNAFYWPSVPVPVIDNNKVYLVGGNGISGGFAVGFMPASVSGFPEIDPVPTYSADGDTWNVVVGWTQARAKNAPCSLEGFDGVAISLPNWAMKATAIRNPNAVIVQGYDGSQSYLSWVSYAPQVTSFDLSPASVATVAVPGSSVVMPCIAWDAANQTLWAFTGESAGHYGSLYAITRTGLGLSIQYTGFTFPPVFGESQGDDVKGLTIDTETGYLRVLLGGGFDNPVRLILLDPLTGTIHETMEVGLNVASTQGKMWDVPNMRKVVFANGYYLYDIPYGVAVEANPVPLSKIVSDVCVRAGLTTNDIDVTELTDLVDGYIVPRQMTARAAIEPLQVVYFFDAVESDDKLKFVKRGGAVAATIPQADRAAYEAGAELPDSLSVLRAQELELPAQCDVEFPDIDTDHLIGNQYERRHTKDTQHRINIRTPVVMTAAKAKQVAAVTLYRAWLNQSFRFTTSRKYAHLEPTDIVALPTSSANFAARITRKVENPNGVIEWEAVMEAISIYSMPTVPAIPNDYVPQVIYDPGETVLHLLDAPMLRDEDDNAGFYVAMDGTEEAWRGASLFKSADSGLTFEELYSSDAAAVIGTAQTLLPDFQGGNIFDEGSTVRVMVSPGSTLGSVTETQVLNGANAALIGGPGRWEVIQFKNAELVGDRVYLLSGLLRGRRGTEWATGTHAIGDAFIQVSVSTLRRVISASELGLLRQYKAPPFRVRLSDVSATSFINTGIALKPFAPVDLVGVRDGSNNLEITWHRRTRMAAGTLHLPTPLGESAEAYSVDILDGDDVVRTISSSTQSATYSAANQTADGITPGAAVTVRVYQISATVGRGYPLEGTV